MCFFTTIKKKKLTEGRTYRAEAGMAVSGGEMGLVLSRGSDLEGKGEIRILSKGSFWQQ